MIDSRHEFLRLAALIDRPRFENEFDALFHPSHVRPSHVAPAGAPAVPTRLTIGPHCFKHAFALSNKEVVRRRTESPRWRHFCGEVHFRHHVTIHPTTMTRWRRRVGGTGCKWPLTEWRQKRVLLRRGATEPEIGHDLRELFARLRVQLFRLRLRLALETLVAALRGESARIPLAA